MVVDGLGHPLGDQDPGFFAVSKVQLRGASFGVSVQGVDPTFNTFEDFQSLNRSGEYSESGGPVHEL